jgi:hypothetical protein
MIADLRTTEGRAALTPMQFLIITALIRVLMVLGRICRQWQAGELPPPRPARQSRYRPATPRAQAAPAAAAPHTPHPHTTRAPACRRSSPSRPPARMSPRAPGMPAPALRRRESPLPPIAPWRPHRPPDSSRHRLAAMPSHAQYITK